MGSLVGNRKKWSLEALGYLLLDINYHLIGCPYFEIHSDEIDKNQDSEIEMIRKYSGKMTAIRVAWLLISSIFILKNFIPMYYITLSLNQIQTIKQINLINNTTEFITSYGCLETNCTSIGQGNDIFSEITFLPVFIFCKPHLKQLFSPIISLQSHGLIIVSGWTFLVLVSGFLLSIYLYFEPMSVDPLLFMLAPNWCRKRLQSKARSIIDQTMFSMTNHRRSVLFEKSRALGQIFVLQDPLDASATCEKDLIDKLIKSNDYLPLIRSDWWKNRMINHCFKRISVSVCLYTVLGISGLLISDYKLHHLNNRLSIIEELTRREGCAFWKSNITKTRGQINFIGQIPPWNLALLLELIFVCYPIFFILSYNLTHQWITLDEICIWIDELNEKVHHAIRECQKKRQTLELAKEKAYNSYLIFGEKLSNVLLERHSTDSIKRMSKFPRKMKIDTPPLSASESMLQVYIGTRLLMDSVQQALKSFSVLIICFNVLHICQIFLLVYYSNKFNSTQLFPLVFTVSILALLDCLILVASNVQARSRNLIALIWQLIAINAPFRDLQTRHLRCLLTKLAKNLSQNKGIVFNVLGISITYATLMKLTLWSTSLTMLMFHDRLVR